MKKSTKTLLVATGVLGVMTTAAIVAYNKTSKALMKLALHREQPKVAMSDKSKEILTGSKELSELLNKMMEASAKLEEAECETVELTAHDGIKLVGHFRPARDPKRIIVAMHGWRSGWSMDFGMISDFYYENGCSVLYAEQRAQGESGGDYMGFGLLERYDCYDWVKWADEHNTYKLPIYLAGISMGASTVLMTSSFDLPESVCGIMADCGYTSPHDIWKHVAENNLHIPYSIYSGTVKDFCEKNLQIAPDAYSCPEALKTCRVPVIFVHGTDDKFVPVEMTYENYKACASPKKLFIVPGAEHGTSYLVDKEGYEEAMLEFWQDNDGVII